MEEWWALAKRHSVHDGWHIPAVCGELLYSPSMQRLFLGLLQQSNDGLQELETTSAFNRLPRESGYTRLCG